MTRPARTGQGAAVLRGVPVALFAAFDEATDALLREYHLATLVPGSGPYGPDDVAAVAAAKRLVGGRIAREEAAVVDVHVELRRDTVEAFGLLQGVLDDANQLARRGEMLALPVLPEIAAFRNWLCDEVTGQAAGAAPAPWRLPEDIAAPGATVGTWDGTADLPAGEAWLVGDDHNRIVGATPAALELLGWADADLVGQRILAVIPPRLREQHLAGFTRATVSGRHTLLGRPLPLWAWTRDGRELPIALYLAAGPPWRGHALYLARIERRPDDVPAAS